jgi:hypothetical protein
LFPSKRPVAQDLAGEHNVLGWKWLPRFWTTGRTRSRPREPDKDTGITQIACPSDTATRTIVPAARQPFSLLHSRDFSLYDRDLKGQIPLMTFLLKKKETNILTDEIDETFLEFFSLACCTKQTGERSERRNHPRFLANCGGWSAVRAGKRTTGIDTRGKCNNISIESRQTLHTGDRLVPAKNRGDTLNRPIQWSVDFRRQHDEMALANGSAHSKAPPNPFR